MLSKFWALIIALGLVTVFSVVWNIAMGSFWKQMLIGVTGAALIGLLWLVVWLAGSAVRWFYLKVRRDHE